MKGDPNHKRGSCLWRVFRHLDANLMTSSWRHHSICIFGRYLWPSITMQNSGILACFAKISRGDVIYPSLSKQSNVHRKGVFRDFKVFSRIFRLFPAVLRSFIGVQSVLRGFRDFDGASCSVIPIGLWRFGNRDLVAFFCLGRNLLSKSEHFRKILKAKSVIFNKIFWGHTNLF